MTVRELIEELQRRLAKHGDIPVTIVWETTVHEILLRNIYLCGRNKGTENPELYFDADDNNSKHVDYVPADEFEECVCGHGEEVHSSRGSYCIEGCDCTQYEEK